jgi:alpha-glucosidase
MFQVLPSGDRLQVVLNGLVVIDHYPGAPFLTVGRSQYKLTSLPGNRHGLRYRVIQKEAMITAQYDPPRSAIRFSGGDLSLTLHIAERDNKLVLTPLRASGGLNHVWMQFPAQKTGPVWGTCGSQGIVDLRGKRLAAWYNSPVRDIHSVSLLTGRRHRSGPYAMPLYIEAAGSSVRTETAAPVIMDFSHSQHRTVEVWGAPPTIEIATSETQKTAVANLSRWVGHAPALPGWCSEGAWLDVRGGTAMFTKQLDAAVSADARFSALVVEDWSGQHGNTGAAFWDWVWNRDHYPKLDGMVRELAKRNIRVLASINPCLAIEGRLFAEASAAGYLVTKPQGGIYLNDFGGFMAGYLDMTHPEACQWYKGVIRKNILDMGMSGFVAGMPGLLPHDAILKSGETALSQHNLWPSHWARLCREAIREAGRGADAVFLSKNGFDKSFTQSSLYDIGGLSPNWGKRNGLRAALSTALSLSAGGIASVCFGIGGEEGDHNRVRTRELLIRWLEMAAFFPVMRLSAGVHPNNAQFYSDAGLLELFARMTKIHEALGPYFRLCLKNNTASGSGVIIPFGMKHPGDKRQIGIVDQFMLGEELLVAPVLSRRHTDRRVFLPSGSWTHLWSGKAYPGGEVTVSAPYGKPPVFFQTGCRYEDLFLSLKLI